MDTHQDRNRLGEETSPYLLQHRDNPVHWWAWGPEALARARAENKPILLSVGYAACHWCHVMAHESFETPQIADLMNRLFINIKVDREERPDLDQIYQQALSLLGQQGGWPLTMFLTPAAEPFWGGTYYPPVSRWGRPGFPDVLAGVAKTFAEDQGKVGRNVAALRKSLERLSAARPGGPVEREMLDQVADRLLLELDGENGGIGDAPKFPQPGILALLWRAGLRSGRAEFTDAVLLTLTRMSQGGIYDHLGGGFARYSTDERWLVPHFEKMLYDNGQLLELLTDAWQQTGDPLYRQRAAETADWVLREMVAEGGGFAATLDADSEGEEGRFYVWTRAEVEALLGADAELFCRVYDVQPDGNWEGKTVLNRLFHPRPFNDEIEARLADCRAQLLAARAERVRPGWDDKVLADWNGLMIAGLARAGAVFGRADWIAAAERALEFIQAQMHRDGRLFHCWRQGRLAHAGTLEDHANLARAALVLFEVTGDGRRVAQAEAWVALCERHFRDAEGGGYFITADDAGDLILRPRHAHDNAVPAGNGTMLAVLARLWLITGRPDYLVAADGQVNAFSGELARNFFPLAGWLNGVETLLAAEQLVLVGDAADTGLQALLAVVWARSLPNLVLTRVGAGQELPPGHPAAGKGMLSGQATAYLCRGQSCSLPVTEPAALAALLDDRPGALAKGAPDRPTGR